MSLIFFFLKKEADINLSEVTSSPYFFPPPTTKEIKLTHKLRVMASRNKFLI